MTQVFPTLQTADPVDVHARSPTLSQDAPLVISFDGTGPADTPATERAARAKRLSFDMMMINVVAWMCVDVDVCNSSTC